MSDPGLPATGLPGTSRSVLHPERLQRVLDALRILSPTAFALGDEEPIDLAARHIVASGAASGDTFAAILQGHLYNMAYVRQWPDGDPPLDANWTPPPDAALMTRLAALRPERLFDGGWQVRSVRPDGGAVLDKNGWTRSAEAGRWGYGDKGHAWVEVPGLHPDAASTFAFLRGRTAGDGDDQGNLFRVYLHTRPGCAADVLEAVVSALDAQCLPFTLKTLMAPASAARADATVLYLSRRYQRAALTCLGRLPEALLEQLGHATPLFALPLRPGLSVAEDPPTGESFGMHRLRLVVRAVLKLWRQGIQDGAARRDAVEKGFAAAGLRFDTPHLGPGSTVAYELYPERAGPEPTSDPASVDPLDIDLSATDPPRTTEPDGEDLEVAARIGARLCRDALWHAGRCTWQGWAMMQRGADDQFVWRSLGPDLYRGTAGICLFLARLHAATGEPGLRETVAGGMAQALAGQDRLEPDVRIGLHTGLAGIGHAAIECGTLLERQDLIDDGLDALELIGGADLRPAMFDVVSGAAGCLAVLLAAAARYQRPRLLEIALRLGDFLVEQARPMGGGVAWGGDAARPPLCGFSHGAGGVSLALADLQAVTGETRFLGVAREGLAYERSQFDPAAGNWIDLRAPAGSPAATTAIAWCHGAPGIALSRLGLLQALGDDEAIRAELDVALATTAQNLRAESSATGPPGSERPLPLGNISLCHGAFGNADVLLLAARRLGQPALEQLARDIGRLAVRQVEARGLSWPSGNPGMHPTPGLMLGDAGAGTFYLRLHDPDGIPSPLWVRP